MSPSFMSTTEREKRRRSLASQGLNEGADWHFVYLKPTHPLYHSFFDFYMAVRDNNRGIAVGDMGLVIGGRLAVLMTAKPLTTESGGKAPPILSCGWTGRGTSSSRSTRWYSR